MQKAHDADYNNYWQNLPSVSTPIIAAQLNRNEQTVDTIDDRVIALDNNKADQSDLNDAVKNVNLTDGTFEIEHFGGTVVTYDTDLDKIPMSYDFIMDPADAHYQNVAVTLADNSLKYIDLTAVITEDDFSDSATISHSISTTGSVSFDVKDGSITDAKIQPNYLADVTAQANSASLSEANAANSRMNAEAWAVGTRNGVPVSSSDPAYNNNARYYAMHGVGTSFEGLSDTSFTDLADGQVAKYDAANQMWVNSPESTGLLPHLIIISETGSTVTVSKTGIPLIYATETSTGHFECDVPEFGTYTVDAVLAGDDAQVSVIIDSVKIYTIDDSHWHADITVNFPNGGTCSCAMTGETTMYANTCPYTFVVHKEGTWTITAIAYGNSYSETVTVTTSGQTETLSLPDGDTATADDVQTWLACGGIGNSSYTTLSEILADSTTLSTLIASANAVKYLARSTTFASTIVTDSGAMTAIGLDNNCSNALLANSTWLTAIIESTYRESILNVKCPTMTSNTTPSGEAIASSEDTASGYYAYKPLDGTSGYANRWQATFAVGAYIGYGWTSAKCIKAVYLLTRHDNATVKSYAIKSFRLEGSDDKSTWADISGDKTVDVNQENSYFAINNSVSYKYYRINIRTNNGGASVVCKKYQLYGREDV